MFRYTHAINTVHEFSFFFSVTYLSIKTVCCIQFLRAEAWWFKYFLCFGIQHCFSCLFNIHRFFFFELVLKFRKSDSISLKGIQFCYSFSVDLLIFCLVIFQVFLFKVYVLSVIVRYQKKNFVTVL